MFYATGQLKQTFKKKVVWMRICIYGFGFVFNYQLDPDSVFKNEIKKFQLKIEH